MSLLLTFFQMAQKRKEEKEAREAAQKAAQASTSASTANSANCVDQQTDDSKKIVKDSAVNKKLHGTYSGGSNTEHSNSEPI